MKNNTLKYILFSLILLFGINLYSDKVYAATSWCPSNNPACQNDMVIKKIKCNYVINKSAKRTTSNSYSDTFSFYRQLEVDDKSNLQISFKITDYNTNNSTIKSNKGNDYYDTNYSCPNSIAYYDNLTLKSDVYFSQDINGTDKWFQNLNRNKWNGIGGYGDELAVYKLDSIDVVDKDNYVALLKNCEFNDDNNNSLIFSTYFFTDHPTIAFFAKSNVPNYAINGADAHLTMLGQYKNTSIYDKIISGDCDSLKYAYLYPNYVDTKVVGMKSYVPPIPNVRRVKYGYIIFSDDNNLINNGSSTLDHGYKNYMLFKNKNLLKNVEENINDAYSEVQDCDTKMKNSCKNNDDDSEDCRKAKEVCYAAEANLNRYCSEANKSLVNNDMKIKCDNAKKTIQNYADLGYSFNVIIDVEVTCETLGGLRDKLQTYFNIIKFLTPVLIIGLGVVDFIQATTSSDDDALKKAKDKFVKRLIIGVIIFLLPSLVDIILQLIEDYYPSSTCGIK